MKHSNWIDYFLLVLVMFFWGLSWPVSKMLINYATSFQIGFFRFLFAGIVFFSILIVKYRRNFKTYTFRSFGKFFLLGLLGIFGYGILFLTAMHYTTSAQGAVIAGIQPSIIAGLAFLIHKEKIYPRWRYFGLAFSFLGVLVIIGIQPFLDFNLDH
ncbi:MAG: DMT family transporter, partial [Promethearchaeota archaeon]